jgi:hypothetical protein
VIPITLWKVPLPYPITLERNQPEPTKNDLPGPLQHSHYVDFISLVSQLKVN